MFIQYSNYQDGAPPLPQHSNRSNLLPPMSTLGGGESSTPPAPPNRSNQSSSTIALVSFKRDDELKPQQRRRRRNLTPEETAALENAFAQSNYLTASMRDDLMAKTSLSLAKLYKWFDNRRSKKRVLTTTVGSGGGTIAPSGSGSLGSPVGPLTLGLSAPIASTPQNAHLFSVLTSSSSASAVPAAVMQTPSAPSVLMTPHQDVPQIDVKPLVRPVPSLDREPDLDSKRTLACLMVIH
jgi:hypothetical protein